jgi:hypothetical protein
MLIKLIFIFIYLQYWSLNSRSSHWVTSPALFLWCVFFEIGPCELFAQAGFKLQSSWYLPPEYIDFQVWVIFFFNLKRELF